MVKITIMRYLIIYLIYDVPITFNLLKLYLNPKKVSIRILRNNLRFLTECVIDQLITK